MESLIITSSFCTSRAVSHSQNLNLAEFLQPPKMEFVFHP